MTGSTAIWVEAARPRTLPAAVAPVLVGTAAASRFIAWRFVAALVVALALQVAVNYANDYFDGVAGIDTAQRTGPRRVVAAGVVAPARMRVAIVVALGIAGVAGLTLVVAVGWPLLVVGLVSMLAALGYSGGSRPYASRGLGEVSVFVFFGLVATIGSQYVHDEAWSWLALWCAIPIGCIAVAILVANNLRDIPTDAATGKRTLAVRLGEARTRRLFVGLLAVAYLGLIPIVVVDANGWAALPLLTVGLAWQVASLVRGAPLGPRLVAALERTGRLHLLFGVTLAAGLLVDRWAGA